MITPPAVLLLGGTGYVGQAFARELARRGWDYRNVRRGEVDYTRYGPLVELLRSRPWRMLINCAGYTGKPNVDACEDHRADTLAGNALLPATVAHACEAVALPWGHVSSGCIFTGAKIRQPDGSLRVESDLTRPEIRRIVTGEPDRVLGFTESDTPNFSFRQPPCSFYSGTKALGEEALEGAPHCHIWRLRIPFDEVQSPRNYLTKLQTYPRVYDNTNSLSHLGDFVRACLDLHATGAPYGIYNVTNPGFVTTREVIERIQRRQPGRAFEFWENDEEFYRVAARTPRSNCVLDTSKLRAAGVILRSVHEALEDALRRWTVAA